MRHYSIALGGLLAVCLLGGLTGTALAQEEEVVARVNGEPLTAIQLEQLAQQRAGVGLEQLNDAQRRQLLEELVTLTVLAQDASEQGLRDDPEVAAQLENLRRAVLAQAMIAEFTSGDDVVSEDEIRAAYEERFADVERKQYHARHILLKEKAKAEELIAQLEGGADFAELAREHSTGPTGASGGDLGWFSPEQMVTPFSEAVAALDKGEFTKEPVQTQYGWHVILLEDTRNAPVPKLADVRDQIRSQLLRQEIQAHLAELREKAEVEYEVEWAQDGES